MFPRKRDGVLFLVLTFGHRAFWLAAIFFSLRGLARAAAGVFEWPLSSTGICVCDVEMYTHHLWF
jgi:hypothetical protein